MLLTIWSVGWYRTTHHLITILHVVVQRHATLLIKIPTNINISCSISSPVSTQAWTQGPWCDVSITFWVLGPAAYWHFLRFTVSHPRSGLFDLLMILVLLEISMCLWVIEILLCCIGRETASSSRDAWVLVLGIKAILNINTSALIINNGSTCCMVNFLNTTIWGGKRMRVYLWIVSSRVTLRALNHINSPIWLWKFLHFTIYYYSNNWI